jgi:hypothetical protein
MRLSSWTSPRRDCSEQVPLSADFFNIFFHLASFQISRFIESLGRRLETLKGYSTKMEETCKQVCNCSQPWRPVSQEKTHILIPNAWFFFNLHRWNFVFYRIHTYIMYYDIQGMQEFIVWNFPIWNVGSLSMVANPHPCWSLAQSQLPHFKNPHSVSPASPLPSPANTGFIYTQMTLTRPILFLSGTVSIPLESEHSSINIVMTASNNEGTIQF